MFRWAAPSSCRGRLSFQPVIGRMSGFASFMAASICSNSSSVAGCSLNPASFIDGVWTQVR